MESIENVCAFSIDIVIFQDNLFSKQLFGGGGKDAKYCFISS